MALGSALVDRGRIIRNEPEPRKVEGRTAFVPVTFPWFRCRLTISDRRVGADAADGRKRVESAPQLLYAMRDEEGQAIDLSAEDQVEVDSPQLGRAIYKLSTAPTPLRKRRTVIGFVVTLSRIEAREFEPRTV